MIAREIGNPKNSKSHHRGPPRRLGLRLGPFLRLTPKVVPQAPQTARPARLRSCRTDQLPQLGQGLLMAEPQRWYII